MALVLASAFGSPAQAEWDSLTAAWNALRGDAYALDALSRWVEPQERLQCPYTELTRYRGTAIRLAPAVRIAEPFQRKLLRFERAVKETAVAIYGRAPRRIRHMGAYNCRRVRGRPTRLSEHALGNAIDVIGFDFGPAPRKQWRPVKVSKELPRRLRWRFRVRIGAHWAASRGAAAIHSRFLRTLAERLKKEPDLFRVMLGPRHPGHRNHFHLDAGPWHYWVL